MASPTPDAWVEVSLPALRHNTVQARSLLRDATRLMAVVKGNGYGHGMVEPARAFLESGADALAVTRLDEAAQLRAGGITAPILAFAPISITNADYASALDVDVTVCDEEEARALASAASRPMRMHLKVDTGMGRLGMPPGEAAAAARSIAAMPNARLAGIYTHFARAMDQDLGPAREQLQRFAAIQSELRPELPDTLFHCANSAAAARMPEAHMDMARIGTLLYGQLPSRHCKGALELRATWSLKARVCQVRMLHPGDAVGYGGEYRAGGSVRSAVLALGYGDGYTMVPEGPIYRQGVLEFAVRRQKRRPAVSFGSGEAPVIGRVSMQLTVVDVTHLPDVGVDSVATVPAVRLATSPLLPRVYLQD